MNQKKENRTLKKILAFAINFVWMMLIYKVILFLADHFSYMIYYIGISVYLAAAAVLFCVFYAKRGYTLSVKPTSPDKLPGDWSPVEKADYLKREADRRSSAGRILYFLLPMILTIIINYIELFIPQFLSSVF